MTRKTKGVDDFDDKQAAALLCSMQTMAPGSSTSGNGEKAAATAAAPSKEDAPAKPQAKATTAAPAPQTAAPATAPKPMTKTSMPPPINQPTAAYTAMGPLPGGIPIYGPVAFPYGVAGMPMAPTQWPAGFFARPTTLGLARPEITYLPPQFAGHIMRPHAFRMPTMLNGTFVTGQPTFMPHPTGAVVTIPGPAVVPVVGKDAGKSPAAPARRKTSSGAAKNGSDTSAAGQAGKEKDASAANDAEDKQCSNCGDTETLRWRKSKDGNTVCNACGIYESVNRCPRPARMKLRKKFTRTTRGGGGGKAGGGGAASETSVTHFAGAPYPTISPQRPVAVREPGSAPADLPAAANGEGKAESSANAPSALPDPGLVGGVPPSVPEPSTGEPNRPPSANP